MRKHLIAAALLASVAMPIAAKADATTPLYLDQTKEDCLIKAAKALEPRVRKHKIDWKLFVAGPKLACNISTDDHENESANAVLTEWWEAFGGAYSQEVK